MATLGKFSRAGKTNFTFSATGAESVSNMVELACTLMG